MKTNDWSWYQRREGAARVQAIEDDTTVRRLRALLKPEVEPTNTVPLWRRVLQVSGLAFQLILVAHGTIEWHGPRLTPAEAVEVVRSSQSDRDWTRVVLATPTDGPVVAIAPCLDCDVINARNAWNLWPERYQRVPPYRVGFDRVVTRWPTGHVWTYRPNSDPTRDVGPSNRVQTGRPNERRQ